MTIYFEAPDGHGESCLWDGPPGDRPLPILRESDCGAAYWPDVVARMTGTTITTDAATVEKIGSILSSLWWTRGMDGYTDSTTEQRAEHWQSITRRSQENWLAEARAVLAALTGVPHDGYERTHDGIRADKAIRPRSGQDG